MNRIEPDIRHDVPVLVFHKVDPRFEWGLTRVTPAQFRSVLQTLQDLKYQTISVMDALNPEHPLPAKPIVITFDDSYASVFEYAFPVLKEFNFTATVFVITGFTGALNEWDVNLGGLKFRHLSWHQVDEMNRAGFEIGSHTVHHPDLTRISKEKLQAEVAVSKKQLEDRLGEPVPLISFPFGRYNDDVIDACLKSDYRHGCGFWIR